MWGRILASFAILTWIALSATGCCCCSDDEDTLAVVASPVRAEWIYRSSWSWSTGGKTLIPFSYHEVSFVVVHTAPATSFQPGCYEPDPQLVSDATGARFAFRCNDSSSWQLVFIGGAGRSILAPNGGLGADATPHWDKAIAFEQVAVDIVRAHGLDATLVDEARARGGDDAVVPILLACADVAGTQNVIDWEKTYDASTDSVKERLRGGLLARLRKGPTPPTVLKLAAGILTDTPDNLDVLQARAEEHVAGSNEEYRDAVTLVALRLAPTRTESAGALACRAVERWISQFTRKESYPSWSTPSEKQALLVIGHARTPCKAVNVPKETFSRLLVDCSNDETFKLCAQQELNMVIDREVERLASATKIDRRVEVPLDTLLLAALHAVGPLPEEIAAAAKRMNYEVVESGPSCVGAAAREQPCVCLGSVSKSELVIGIDPRPGGTGKNWACRVRADDTQGKLIVLSL